MVCFFFNDIHYLRYTLFEYKNNLREYSKWLKKTSYGGRSIEKLQIIEIIL